MAGYISRVRQDIDRWAAVGLIDKQTAVRLSDDIGRNAGRAISFGTVLAVMAAILLGASVLVFIAANWEAIPRLVRVSGLFALILASYVGGAVLKARDHAGFGEALYLVGAAAFGASIALIGQMYHFSGDETGAVLIWCLGTIAAAAGLRSPMLTNAAVVLSVVWFVMRSLDFGSSTAFPHVFLLMAAAIWAISYWTRSVAARHLLLLAVILYAVVFGVEANWITQVGIVLALLSVLVFLAAYLAPDHVERFAKLGGPYPVHPLIGFLVGISMAQVEIYDHFVPMLVATLIAFAGIVAALLMRGRQSTLMRWLAYAGFTVELIFLYAVTLGTMIDTAGLFLFSGLALAVTAFLIRRIERRFGAAATEEAAQ